MNIEEQIHELVEQANPLNPVSYVTKIVKDLAHNKLTESILECTDCECNTGNIKTLPHGNVNASLLVISDKMSEEQFLNGESCFVLNDSYGEIFSQAMDIAGLNIDECYFVNSVSCFVNYEKNGEIISRAPKTGEIKQCSTFLNYAIDTIQPLAILLLGSIPTNIFEKLKINENVGKIINVKGIPAFVNYNPGYFEYIKKTDEEMLESKENEFIEVFLKIRKYFEKHYANNNLLK